jgi:plastocyanin domain-containing protein
MPQNTSAKSGRTVLTLLIGLVLVAFLGIAFAQVMASRQPDVAPGGGGVQSFAVDTASSRFVPNTLTAKAGVPIEIVFGAGGNSCSSAMSMPDLGIQQDLTAGATVKIPALKAGKYEWIAACGDVGGTITVQ